jgi:hypothetical protein
VRIKIVLATGLALIAIAVFVALLHSPSTVASANGIPLAGPLAATQLNLSVCQQGETLIAGTSAIRLQVEATTGPLVAVGVVADGHLLAQGNVGTGWYGSAVTVPVRPSLARTVTDATVCLRLSSLSGEVVLFGAPTKRAPATTASGRPLPGRLRVEYLQSARRSWWSFAGAVIAHMGLGRAASGTWIVIPILALALAAIAVGSWTLVRELR